MGLFDRWKRWRVLGDGEIGGYYWTGPRAWEAAQMGNWSRYAQQRKVGSRWFTEGFGFRDASLSELVAMGVPINAKSLADDEARSA